MDKQAERINERLKVSRRRKRLRNKALFYISMSLIALFMSLPFVWMISTSLKAPGIIFASPPVWLPYYHYIVEDGQITEVNIIKETWNVKATEGEFRGETFSVINKSAFGRPYELKTEWRAWWLPWAKDYYLPVAEDGQVSLTEGTPVKVEKIGGEAEIDILEGEGEDISLRQKVIPLAEVSRGIKPVWQNYVKVLTLKKPSFLRFYWNSVFVALCVTVGQVLTSAMAAYSFARLNFPGRDKLFLGYLATMMIPYAVVLVPVFILMNWLNWIDTYKALIVPAMFSAYGTFLLRQFFMAIPVDLEDAARIDGCGYFRIFMHIILPLSKPALATLTFFTFMGSWMSFMWPLIVTNRPEMKTLPVGLAYFQETGYGTEYHLLMAGSLLAMLPLILIFIFNQRFFVEAIKLQGLKG